MSFSPLKIIISAGAGTSDKNVVRERLASIFNQNKIDIDMSVAQSGAEVTELAQDAARGPYKVLVAAGGDGTVNSVAAVAVDSGKIRSEEHTSELQSLAYLVCRLLLEKKKGNSIGHEILREQQTDD